MSGLDKTEDKIISPDPNAYHDVNDLPSLEHKQSQKNSQNQKNKKLHHPKQDENLSENIPRQIQSKIPNDNQVLSQNLNLSQKRQKVPSSLKLTLRKKALQSGHFKAKKSPQNMSKFGKNILSKIKKEQIQCKICLSIVDEKNTIKLCSCSHTFCKGCIRDYLTYKIKMYEEVFCPEEKCDTLMNQNTQFYQKLPEGLKKQYTKIHNFYVSSKNPNLRLCPRQNCEGIINLIEKQPPTCVTCKKQFCSKCFFEKHDGSCDQREVDFLQNNFHYRQCQRCKTVVERTEGCNHMTCKCKYEFCYICGNKWNLNHRQCYRIPGQRNAGLNRNNIQQDPRCCNETCRECPAIDNIICNITVSFFFIWFVLLVVVFKLVLLTMYFAASIVAGITFFPFDILCETGESKNYVKLALLIVFFPITISLGIYKAMTEMFYDLASYQVVEVWEMIKEECFRIWP